MPALGTEAVLPVEPEHTELGAVMAAVGLMVMVLELVLEQPAMLVTVAPRVTVLLVPALKLMLEPP